MSPMIELNNNLHTNFARAQAFMPKQVLGFVAIAKFLFEEALVWGTRPCEVFLRWKFGTRGHSLFQTWQICVAGAWIGWLAAHYDLVVTGFCLAAAVLSLFHRIEAVRWEMKGRPRFSWSNGEPTYLLWGWIAHGLHAVGINPDRVLSAGLISRFYEPLIVLAVGLTIRPISVALGYYLIGCSVAMFVKGLIVHNRLLTLQRDQRDARIMGQWLIGVQRAVAGQGDEEFFVVRLAPAPGGGGTEGEPDKSPEPQSSPDTAITAGNLLVFNCQKCKTEFKLNRQHIGKRGRCRKCHAVMVVGAPT
jgi:hypothetical protein